MQVIFARGWSSIEALKTVVCCWRGVGYSNKLAKSYILLEANRVQLSCTMSLMASPVPYKGDREVAKNMYC